MAEQERKTARHAESRTDEAEATPALAETGKKLTVYARSFGWDDRNTETDRDRAALLSAVGWCSGWEGGFVALGDAGR